MCLAALQYNSWRFFFPPFINEKLLLRPITQRVIQAVWKQKEERRLAPFCECRSSIWKQWRAQQVVMLTVSQQHACERSTGACLCLHVAWMESWRERMLQESSPTVSQLSKKKPALLKHLPHFIRLAFLHGFVPDRVSFFALVVIILRVCVCVRDRRNRHPRGCNLSPVICCPCCVCGLVIEPVRFEADIDSVIYLFLTFIAVAFLL